MGLYTVCLRTDCYLNVYLAAVPIFYQNHQVLIPVLQVIMHYKISSFLSVAFHKNYGVPTCLFRLFHHLKELYVTLRNFLLTMTPVAIKSTTLSILLLSFTLSSLSL